MKISRYIYQNKEHYGILNQQTLLSLPALAKNLKIELPHTIEKFIITSENSIKITQTMLNSSQKKDITNASVLLNEVQLLAPIVFPPKILCLGWNYIDHAAETKMPLPEEPVVFMKPHTTIIGPNEKIIKRPFIKELDYEGELAIVIGKKAKDISVAEAEKCIFGYTILNDVSARDFQFKDKQWTRGKGFDTFAPTGPCIATKDQISNPNNLNIKTWVNGELRQNANTKDMVFSIPKIIYHLSRVMTLEPCDVIATGTPSGVGMAMKPQVWLKDCDEVKIEIEGIGTLENKIEEH